MGTLHATTLGRPMDTTGGRGRGTSGKRWEDCVQMLDAVVVVTVPAKGAVS